MNRREFIRNAGWYAAATALTGCTDDPPADRYNQADRDLLARQQREEEAASGRSPFGPRVYRGYRGLAELPWFDLGRSGQLRCIDESIPRCIDVHCHLGISVLLSPDIDLQARTPRVRHLLDCDGTDPACRLDLDVYANSNFTEEGMRALRTSTLAQGLWIK